MQEWQNYNISSGLSNSNQNKVRLQTFLSFDIESILNRLFLGDSSVSTYDYKLNDLVLSGDGCGNPTSKVDIPSYNGDPKEKAISHEQSKSSGDGSGSGSGSTPMPPQPPAGPMPGAGQLAF